MQSDPRSLASAPRARSPSPGRRPGAVVAVVTRMGAPVIAVPVARAADQPDVAAVTVTEASEAPHVQPHHVPDRKGLAHVERLAVGPADEGSVVGVVGQELLA